MLTTRSTSFVRFMCLSGWVGYAGTADSPKWQTGAVAFIMSAGITLSSLMRTEEIYHTQPGCHSRLLCHLKHWPDLPGPTQHPCLHTG